MGTFLIIPYFHIKSGQLNNRCKILFLLPPSLQVHQSYNHFTSFSSFLNSILCSTGCDPVPYFAANVQKLSALALTYPSTRKAMLETSFPRALDLGPLQSCSSSQHQKWHTGKGSKSGPCGNHSARAFLLLHCQRTLCEEAIRSWQLKHTFQYPSVERAKNVGCFGELFYTFFSVQILCQMFLLGGTHGVYLPQLGKADLFALSFWNKRWEPLGPLQFPLIPIFSGPGSSLTQVCPRGPEPKSTDDIQRFSILVLESRAVDLFNLQMTRTWIQRPSERIIKALLLKKKPSFHSRDRPLWGGTEKVLRP